MYPKIRAGFANGAICELLNLNVAKPNTLVRLATTIVLLIIMFVGLLSNHLYESSTYSLGRLLWKQVCYRFTLNSESGVFHPLICSPFSRV